MTEHVQTGALARAFAIPHLLHDWYQEQTFWLYYYGLSHSPKDTLRALPIELSPAFIERVSSGIDAARAGFIDKTATRIASGEETKPSFSNALKGFLANSQINLRPALDIAMRTGFGTPLRMVAIGLAILLVGDALSGGHIRDSITQAIASFNTESGRATSAVSDRTLGASKAGERIEAFTLYAQPSFS